MVQRVSGVIKVWMCVCVFEWANDGWRKREREQKTVNKWISVCREKREGERESTSKNRNQPREFIIIGGPGIKPSNYFSQVPNGKWPCMSGLIINKYLVGVSWGCLCVCVCVWPKKSKNNRIYIRAVEKHQLIGKSLVRIVEREKRDQKGDNKRIQIYSSNVLWYQCVWVYWGVRVMNPSCKNTHIHIHTPFHNPNFYIQRNNLQPIANSNALKCPGGTQCKCIHCINILYK